MRFAVVGLGYWGPNLVRNLHELPDVEVAWLCDKRPDVLEHMRRRFPSPQRTQHLGDVLDDETVDAILIATPVATHFPIAAAALQRRKHVFVEKPLAASVEEANRLVALASEHQLVLMPGHTFLYSPPVNMIRSLIQDGELGEIYFISTSRVNLGLHQPDVSVVWDLGPHDFSILRYWLDERPEYVSGLSRGCVIPGTPDVAFINLEFASGVVSHVELAWLAPSKLRRTTVVGSEKMVVYDDTSIESVRIFDAGVTLPDPMSFGEYKLTYRTGSIVSPRVPPVEPLLEELGDFVLAILTGKPPRSNAQLGVDVVQVVEAVDRSFADGGARVLVDGTPLLELTP